MLKVNPLAVLGSPASEIDGKSLPPPAQRGLEEVHQKYQPAAVQPSTPSTKLIISLLFVPLGLFAARWAIRLRQLSSPANTLIFEAQPWLVGRVERCLKLPEFVEELLSLSPDERKTLLSMVRDHSPPIDREMQRVLKLALFDPETWNNHFRRLAENGLRDQSLYTTLVPLLERMPRPLQDSLFAKIPALYPLAEKGGWFSAECYLDPRRTIDTFIRGTVKAEYIIGDAIAEGKTAWEAYQRYLSTIRDRIFAGTDYGDYDIEAIRAVTEALKRVLRQAPPKWEDASVTLYGSFPNGKALLASSDLDIMLSDPGLSELLPAMESAVTTSLRPHYPLARLPLSENHSLTLPSEELGLPNPLMIRINATQVELVVHPFPTRAQWEAFSDGDWPEPLVYPLS